MQAAKGTINTGGKNSKTKRVSVPTTGTSITLPTKIQSAVFRNGGANDIRLRINATGNDYFTLKADESTPKVLVNGSTIDAAAVGTASFLECIFEG